MAITNSRYTTSDLINNDTAMWPYDDMSYLKREVERQTYAKEIYKVDISKEEKELNDKKEFLMDILSVNPTIDIKLVSDNYDYIKNLPIKGEEDCL